MTRAGFVASSPRDECPPSSPCPRPARPRQLRAVLHHQQHLPAKRRRHHQRRHRPQQGQAHGRNQRPGVSPPWFTWPAPPSPTAPSSGASRPRARKAPSSPSPSTASRSPPARPGAPSGIPPPTSASPRPFKPVPGEKGKTFAQFQVPGKLEVYPEKDGDITILADVSVKGAARAERKTVKFSMPRQLKKKDVETIFLPAEIISSVRGNPKEWSY